MVEVVGCYSGPEIRNRALAAVSAQSNALDIMQNAIRDKMREVMMDDCRQNSRL